VEARVGEGEGVGEGVRERGSALRSCRVREAVQFASGNPLYPPGTIANLTNAG
jgi:hypothetical protein